MAVSECGDCGNGDSCNKCGHYLRVSVAASQGGRKYMEDRVHVECVRAQDGSIDYTYIAVYDGHGGAEASEFVRRNLLGNIQTQHGFDGDDEHMLAAIKAGFIQTHLSMWKVVDEWPLTTSGYTSTAGTTASCVFIRRGKLFTAHVGDSAIVLGRVQGDEVKGLCLTVDHKPESEEEEKRINAAGGMIMRKSGIMRVVWTRPVRGHVGPVKRSTPTESIAFLAVARALGDLWSYNEDTKQFVVSPEPDVGVVKLDACDQFIVLASDGLTNVLKAQRMTDIVHGYEAQGCDEGGLVPNHSRWLLRYALQCWGSLRADNISVVTVMLDGHQTEMSSDMVLSSGTHMNVEEELTHECDCLVTISPSGYQQLPTIPVQLVYAGAVDNNFGHGLQYKGPGFCAHSPIDAETSSVVVPQLTLLSNMFSLPPRPPPIPLVSKEPDNVGGESTSTHVFDTVTPSQQCAITALASNRKRHASVVCVQGTSTTPLVTTPVKYMCKKHGFDCHNVRIRNQLYEAIKANDSSCVEIDIDCESNDDLYHSLTHSDQQSPRASVISEEHAYASKSDAVLAPITTTPLSGRKRVLAIRRTPIHQRKRSQARRNLVVRGYNDPTDEHSLTHSLPITLSVASDTQSKRSLGGACALSPALMLAALRTPEGAFNVDRMSPITRDISLSNMRSRSLSLGNSPICTPLQPINTTEHSHEVKCEMDEGEHSEPAVKRSRFWGFFTNILSGRGN